jgi:hypothetical protein
MRNWSGGAFRRQGHDSVDFTHDQQADRSGLAIQVGANAGQDSLPAQDVPVGYGGLLIADDFHGKTMPQRLLGKQGQSAIAGWIKLKM